MVFAIIYGSCRVPLVVHHVDSIVGPRTPVQVADMIIFGIVVAVARLPFRVWPISLKRRQCQPVDVSVEVFPILSDADIQMVFLVCGGLEYPAL